MNRPAVPGAQRPSALQEPSETGAVAPLTVRAATLSDAAELERVYTCARRFMAQNGNPTQWKNGYPRPEQLAADIRRGEAWVCVRDGAVHGAFVLAYGVEPSYAVIRDGRFLSDAPYATIHRLAGDGAATGVFAACAVFCKARSAHLRADTHADNRLMQRLLKGAGFVRRGVIFVADGSPRFAYEWQREEQTEATE